MDIKSLQYQPELQMTSFLSFPQQKRNNYSLFTIYYSQNVQNKFKKINYQTCHFPIAWIYLTMAVGNSHPLSMQMEWKWNIWTKIASTCHLSFTCLWRVSFSWIFPLSSSPITLGDVFTWVALSMSLFCQSYHNQSL